MKSRRSKFGETSNGIIIGGVVEALIAVVGIYFLTKKSVNVSSAPVNVSSPPVSVPVPVIYSILNQPQSYYDNLTDPNVATNITINIANTPLATIKSLPKDQQEYLGAIIWGLGDTFANNAAYTALDNSWSKEQKNVLEYVIGKLLMAFNSKINSTFNSKHSPVPASRRGSTPASR